MSRYINDITTSKKREEVEHVLTDYCSREGSQSS
jgi:hypothetical protein